MTRVPAAAIVALVLAGAAARAAGMRAHDPVPTTPTFAAEVRGVLSAHCTSCHAAGGSAPMPLTTVEEIRPWAGAIRDHVLTRRMPKWHAARGYGAFVNDPSLTPYEQALLLAWIDAGMPEGTPRGAAASRPMMSFAPASAGEAILPVIVAARADLGRSAGRRDTWIRGWSFSPGDPLITAAVVSVDGTSIAAWVAGDGPARLPPGVGIRGGARVRVDVRRRAAAANEALFVPRRSVLSLLIAEQPPARRAWTEQVSCGALRAGPPATVLAVRPLLDRAEARVSVSRPGAPAAIVGWFREFDPLYPRTYWLMRPIELAADTRLVADGGCRVELTLTGNR